MRNNTHLKNGQLSKYGYLCGYVTKKQFLKNGEKFEASMYLDSVWHVRSIKIDDKGCFVERVSWQCFEGMSDAKKHFKNIARK